MVHAPCNAIVHEDNGEMSMSDPALFQSKAPLLPIGLVIVFATATTAASWGVGPRRAGASTRRHILVKHRNLKPMQCSF